MEAVPRLPCNAALLRQGANCIHALLPSAAARYTVAGILRPKQCRRVEIRVVKCLGTKHSPTSVSECSCAQHGINNQPSPRSVCNAGLHIGIHAQLALFSKPGLYFVFRKLQPMWLRGLKPSTHMPASSGGGWWQAKALQPCRIRSPMWASPCWRLNALPVCSSTTRLIIVGEPLRLH